MIGTIENQWIRSTGWDSLIIIFQMILANSFPCLNMNQKLSKCEVKAKIGFHEKSEWL